ncbi:HGxxPAAW family protein [Streptomyces sp. NPDC060065]|uniref:HGxxPAAW family protein n=1 Tax=Streptomyces sp. NPDC060065 TaxID=3347050 RepID=UPI00369F2825
MAGSSHGHTPAAWTGVTIAFIGFCVSGAFTVTADPLGFWAGLVIVALGGVVGMVMQAAGLGKTKAKPAQPAREREREAVGAEG